MAEITLPDGSVVSFPDSMSDDQMASALQQHVAPQMREEPFTDPMSGQVLGTQMAPSRPGPGVLDEPAKFGITAGARGLGALADFFTDPLRPLRTLVSPELADMEKQERANSATRFAAEPGATTADAFFRGTGIPEYKPESAGGRIGLAAAEGAVAGGPFGLVPAAVSALSGLAGQGTMEATGSPRAATAAGLGTALLGGAGAQAAGGYFRPAPAQGAAKLAGRIQSDARGGGPDIEALRQALANVQDKPLSLMDVAGTATRGMGEAIANRPGEGAQIAETFLNQRDAGAGPRLLGDLGDAFGMGPSAFQTAKTLAEQRATNAAPLYENALAPGKTIHSDRLQQFLEDPITQQGLAQGLEVQRLESLAEGRPFKPSDYTVVYDDTGTPRFSPTPNMRTLDAAKRGLDNILDQYRDPVTGRLNLDQRGRAIEQVRQAYLGELDSLNPDYAAARQAWSGPSQSLSAMKQGASVFNQQPEQIAENISRLAPGDRDFFLLGARDALAQRIAKTSTGGNEALRIVGNQYIQNQLRPLFSSDADYRAFINRAQLESLMYRTKSETLGNSRTYRRLANDAAEDNSGGVLGNLAIAGGAVAAHEPFAAIPTLMRLGRGAANWLSRPSPEVDANIARMLFTGDPAANAQTLDILSGAGRRPSMLPYAVPGMAPSLMLGERGR